MENCSILRVSLLIFSLYFVKCQFVLNQHVEENYDKDSLPLILKFLNDDVKATIIYKSGKILHSQLKGDILEVDLQAVLTCKSLSEQCNYESADCRGLLYAPPNAELQVLSVDCNPNLPIVEEPLALPIQTQPCTGCLTDINVDAEGVEPLVKTIIQHVEAERNRRYTLLEVLRVQHQVVNGVNFVLTVKIAPAICNVEKMECTRDPNEEDVFCVVKLFQEPGYEKPKNIISNNCTQSQTFIPTMTKLQPNGMNDITVNTEKHFNHEKNVALKKPERSENDVLNDLMAQIIPLDKFESTSKKDVELVQSNPMKSIESSSVHNLEDENGQSIVPSSTFQEVVATEDEPISLGTDTAEDMDFTSNGPSPSSASSEGTLPTSVITEHPNLEEVIIPQHTADVKKENVQVQDEDALHKQIKLERMRRSAVNSEKFTSKEKSAIQNIADFVASTLDVIDDDDHKRIVLQIINVKKVKTDALFLNMNLRIGVSRCGENESGANCKNDLLDTTKFCKVQVMINEDFENPKIVKSHCENEKRIPRKSNHTTNVRRRRALLGGKEDISVNDSKVKEYLNEAVNYMNAKLSKGDSQYKITKVLSATTQVVSGISYDIKVEMNSCFEKENSVEECQGNPKICDIHVWYQAWLNSRLITVDCGDSKISFNALDSKNRSKREVLVGGHFSVKNDDPRLEKHLNKLLPQLDAQSGKDHKLKIKKIVSATTQVVAGTNWNIKAEVALSDCSKTDDKEPGQCAENKNSFATICKFKFWERLPNEAGLRDLDNIEISCDESKLNYQSKQEIHRSRRQLLGGYETASPDDPQIRGHLNNLLPKLDAQSGKGEKLKIKKIISAESQVVAGTNWKIKAEVGLSDCSKSDSKKLEDCGLNKDPFTTVCTFKFTEKLPNKDGVSELDNIEVCCDEPKLNFRSKRDASLERIKRQVVGGHNPLPTDDPRIVKHLNNLLPKLDTQSGKGEKLKIKKIISATSQVVAGTNWNIKAEVELSDCSKSDSKKLEECGLNKDPFTTVCTFKFWEKLPNKEGVRELDNVEVSCDKPELNFRSKRDAPSDRIKRQVVGGHNPLPTDDPRIVKHLNNLLPKLDSQSGKGEKLKIKKIISASSQVVAGTNWNIKAEVELSDCSKSDSKKLEECGVNKDTFKTVCTFKFWEKLPNKDGVRELDNIEVSCDEPKLNFRSKRDAPLDRIKRQVVGGHNPLPTDDPRIVKHLNNLLPKLDSQSGKGEKLKIKKIISATSQVVAGTNWNIKAEVELSDCTKSDSKKLEECGLNKDPFTTICTFKFWEKLPNKDGVRELDNIEVSCDEPKLNFRSKRDAPLDRTKRQVVGGHNPLPTDDPRIVKHLNNLLPKLDSQSGKGEKLKIKKIISATSQVVAGTNWNIKAEVELSDCTKSDSKKLEECGVNKDPFTTICTFKFWEKLPNKDGVRELDNIEVSCDEPKLNFRSKRDAPLDRTKRQVVGGHNPLPTNDPQISKHLYSLLPQLDSQSGKDRKLKVKEIISATSQVVAGTNWNIKARVILSNCLKSENKKSEDCEGNAKELDTICTFKFWEKLPNKNGIRIKENIEVKCDEKPELNYRSKRDVGMPGEEFEVDKNEPLIYEYLSKSLQHIDLNSPEENKFKVKEILSATKQIVEGELWRIKISLILSDCSKNDITNWDQCGDLQGSPPKICTVKIWDRPWLKQGRETNITCENQKTEYTFRTKRSIQLGQDNHDLDTVAFIEFEQKYKKRYPTSRERAYRFSIFRENMKYVKLLNDHEEGTAVYGASQFADLTRKEFSKQLGYRSDLRNENELSFLQADIPDVELPDAFDWRDKKAVASVKNQGSCGSCWAFSVTGNVEGQYAIKTGQLLEFSEQELVDCDTVDEGCNGGLMDNAYRQIERLGGLEQEQDYPYDAKNEKCHFNKTLVRVELSGAVNISTDETDMAKWLVKNGPISIAINANAMQFYMGGVSHPWKFLCNPKSLDHGVLIVGYGVHKYPKFKKSLPYWIVKNSWGPSWGERGYYRVYRGDGTCGVNQTPSSAILK